MIDVDTTLPPGISPGLRILPLAAPRAERLARWSIALAVAFMPLLRPAGPGNLAPVDAWMGLAFLAFLVWAASTKQPLRAPFALSVALLAVAGAIGAMAGPVPATGIVAIGQDLWLLAWALAIVNVARSPEVLRSIVVTWSWSAFGWAVVLLIGLVTGNHALSGITASEGGRTALTFGDPNYAANYFVVSIMVIWASGCPRSRILRLCAYGTLLTAWAFTGSNSGIVALVVALAVAGVVTAGRRFGPVAMVAASCLLLLLAFTAIPNIHLGALQRAAQASRYQLLKDWVGRSPSSIDERRLLVGESIGLYFQGGLLGQGPVSTKSRLIAAQAPYVKEAHDDYLAALTERGIIGGVGLFLLLASLLTRTWAVASGTLSRRFIVAVPRTAPLVGAVVGTLVSGTVYELLHVRHVWALFAVIAALQLWGRE